MSLRTSSLLCLQYSPIRLSKYETLILNLNVESSCLRNELNPIKLFFLIFILKILNYQIFNYHQLEC